MLPNRFRTGIRVVTVVALFKMCHFCWSIIPDPDMIVRNTNATVSLSEWEEV